MTQPGKSGRRPGAPRRMKCVGCGERTLTMKGWPFRCDGCPPVIAERDGPIFHDERRAIRGHAHTIVARAIREGNLPRPSASACMDCGQPAEQYDHRDYTQPLKVEAVCRRCNLRRGPALVWTADGRRPIDGRLLRHMSAAAIHKAKGAPSVPEAAKAG